MKKNALLTGVLAVLLLCGGCQGSQESDTLTVVAGIAVDGKTGDYRLTTETVVAGGDEGSGGSTLVDSRGTTLAGGLLNAMNLTAKKLYFTHAQVMLVSEQVAAESFTGLLDAIQRENDFRLALRLVVTEGSAGDMIAVKLPEQDATSFALRAMTDTSWQNGGSPDTPLYRFLDDVGEPGIEGILPLAGVTESQGEPALVIRGTALFRDDAYAGKLDARESQALLWMRTGRDGGIIEEEDLSLEILSCRRELECDGAGAVIRLHLLLQEQEGSRRGAQLKEIAEGTVQRRCEGVIQRLKALNCDAVGLGQALLRSHRSQAERVKRSWDTEFSQYPVRVEVTAKIWDQGRTKGGSGV